MHDERPQGLGPWPARDLVHAEALTEQEVADDIDGVVARLGHHVGERPGLPAQVLRVGEGAEPKVGPAAGPGVGGATRLELGTQSVTRGGVSEARLERFRSAGLDPARELDQQARARPLGRVGVEGDVEALRSRVVDQRQHRLGPAWMRLTMVEVGDVGGRAGAPSDLDRLAERVQVAVAQRVAHMRVVEPAGATGRLGERGEFLGRGVAAGRVVEARGQAHGSLGHRVAQQSAHPVQGGGRRGLVVPADRPDPERGVADQRRDVEADRAVIPGEVALDGAPRVVDVGAAIEAGVQFHEGFEVGLVLERREPVAIDADDLGGHSLADLGLMLRLREDREPAVTVQVDEPGRHDRPGGIDGSERGQGRCVRPRGRQELQSLTADADTPRSPGCAGPVDDRAARDQEVERLGHANAMCIW